MLKARKLITRRESRLVSLDHVHIGAPSTQRFGQHVAGLGRPRNQDMPVAHHLRTEKIQTPFGLIARRNKAGFDSRVLQLSRGLRTDGANLQMRERRDRLTLSREPRYQRLDSVDAGDDQPIIAGDFANRLIEASKVIGGSYLNGGKLNDRTPEFFESSDKLLRLSARPRNDNALAG